MNGVEDPEGAQGPKDLEVAAWAILIDTLIIGRVLRVVASEVSRRFAILILYFRLTIALIVTFLLSSHLFLLKSVDSHIFSKVILIALFEVFLCHSHCEVISSPNLFISILYACKQLHDSEVLLLHSFDHIEIALANKLLVFVGLVADEVDRALLLIDSCLDCLGLNHLTKRCFERLHWQPCLICDLCKAQSQVGCTEIADFLLD